MIGCKQKTVALLLIILFLIGCGGGGSVQPVAPTVGVFSVPTKTYGDGPFTLVAPTSNSAGAFTFSSNNGAVANVIGDTLTLSAAGTATITAIQAASGNFTAASTTAILTVTAVAPTLGPLAPIAKTYGDNAFSLVAPTSNSAGLFNFVSDNPAVGTIAGNIVTITGAGSAKITARQAASGNYAAADTSTTLTVSAATPTLSTFEIARKPFGAAQFTPTLPTSESPGAITYASNTAAVATVGVTTGLITVIGAGVTTITATQAATGNYLSSSTTATFIVDSIRPTLGIFANVTKSWGDAPFALVTPTSNSAGGVTFSVPQGSVVAGITGSVVTILAAPATETITATQAASGNYTSGSTSMILTVNSTLPPGYRAQAGVTWSPVSAARYVWTDADVFCAAAIFIGQGGWRLPTSSELNTAGSFGDQIFMWTSTSGDAGMHWFGGYSPVFPSGWRSGAIADSNLVYATCVHQ